MHVDSKEKKEQVNLAADLFVVLLNETRCRHNDLRKVMTKS
jgi:hypothetical protein